MGVPTWEVGYTSAMARREGHVGHWIKKKSEKMYTVILRSNSDKAPKILKNVFCYASSFCIWKKCISIEVNPLGISHSFKAIVFQQYCIYIVRTVWRTVTPILTDFRLVDSDFGSSTRILSKKLNILQHVNVWFRLKVMPYKTFDILLRHMLSKWLAFVIVHTQTSFLSSSSGVGI